MKTKEELNALKNEVEAMSKKLSDLSEDELNLVTGGFSNPPMAVGSAIPAQKWLTCPNCGKVFFVSYYVDTSAKTPATLTGLCPNCLTKVPFEATLW